MASAVGGGAIAPNRAQLSADLAGARAVWGLGVQFRHFNLRGHCVPAFVSEQGIGRGAPETQPMTAILNMLGGGAGGNDYTTYASSASVLTSAGSGLLLENSELSFWDLGRCPRTPHARPHTHTPLWLRTSACA